MIEMPKFETLISNAINNPNSEVYFTGIMIANKGQKSEFYIDPRTWERPDGLKVVLPFCFHNNSDWYICPDCGQIHMAYGYGKRETGCCEDIDCMRPVGKGCHDIFIQRDPIVIQEADDM
jgi:hypothetical protein